jgi:hypothetical protein
MAWSLALAVFGGKPAGKTREGEAWKSGIRSGRRAGAQKIVLRSDFVVVPP